MVFLREIERNFRNYVQLGDLHYRRGTARKKKSDFVQKAGPFNDLAGRGTSGKKAGLSRQKQDGWQVCLCTFIFVVVFVAISFVICVSNRYKLNKNFLKLKAKSAAHYDDLALKTQCTQAQVGKTQVHSVYISAVC